MRYISVEWLHKFENEPVRLLSELDDEGFEIRKVEIFSDGSMGFARGYGPGCLCGAARR